MKNKLKQWVKKHYKYYLFGLIIYFAILGFWTGLELILYGHTNPSIEDSIIGIILLLSICLNYLFITNK